MKLTEKKKKFNLKKELKIILKELNQIVNKADKTFFQAKHSKRKK